MAKLLALDLSTKTGWAYFETCGKSEEFGTALENFKLVDNGLIKLGQNILTFEGEYPRNVMRAVWTQVDKVLDVVFKYEPSVIVIEDTVPGRQALSQRFLEWLHYNLLSSIESEVRADQMPKIVYLKTGVWRQNVGLKQSKADAKNNKIANKIKSLPKDMAKKMRKETGVRGKISKKHQAVRMVNERFSLNFKVKDNDRADAILLGCAFLQGAPICDGT
jgi:hypothetical protein